MSKTQEFKAYGSIRKMKVGGACGVILALAMLGMVFSSTASADEVSVNASENKTILEVPIVHEKLDKAIAEAKAAGVKVDVGVTQDKGVATTDTVADKQKEIEADYVNQEKNVKTVTDDYSSKVDKTTKEREVIEKENKDKQDKFEKDVKDHEAEVKRVEAENKAILADNDKKQKEIEAENTQIKRDNDQKEADYKTALANQKSFNDNVDKENANVKSTYETKLEEYRKKLAVYEKQQAELNNKDLKIEKPHIKVYGDYDESQRGSLDYYKKLTVSFEGVEDLIDVKDYIGLHSDSSITASREGLLSKSNEFFGEIVDPKAGDSFTIHNVAERKDGNKISARFTFNKVEAEWVENGKSLSPTKIYVHKDDSGSGSINFLFANLVEFNTKIDFFYEKDKKEVVLAVASAFNDIDYGQELNLTYQDGSEGIVLNPNGSDVKKVVRDGKNYYKGEYKTPWTYDVPELGVNAGDLGYANVRDEKDIPRGSIVSIGYGSTLNLGYHNGVGQRAPHEIFQERVNAIRDALYEGKKTPPDSEIFSSKKVGWAVGLFGKASATVPINIHVNPPLKPELKPKDTKEIPKPKLEKPKEFVPRTTLPIPPAPTPPEKKKIPEMPLVPTVKVNYSRLRVKPSTPKPVKAITDNYGHNIDGATTFDKNVKFSLTTDYKPYSTFTADSKNVAKTWALADDVQDGAYMVDDSKITMKDSIGKDVKALFNMYHVLSEKERTQEIQNILKETGLNPKGEFYLWVAKDSTSFYQNYVKQAKNITIDLPARLLVKAGEVVENEFVQVDYDNGYKSNLVTVKVPDVKPEKHVLDRSGKKVLDGKEVQLGDFIQYLLDGVTVPEKHDTLYQYDGLDKLDTKHDRYTGNWKGIVKGTEYTAEKELTLPYDVILKDGKVVKAGDKIAKGSSYAFTFEFNQGTNSEFIKKLVTVKWDDKGGQWSYVINQDFLNSLGIKGTFDADFYIEVERIETGDKIENTFVNIVNKQEMTAKVITRTPEPPKPKHPEKHALDKTGQKVLDGKEVQMGELIQYLLDGSMIPERHHTLYQYDGLDKLDTKHDRYTGNWKGIVKGTEYTAEKELTLPYDVILKDGKVVKAGDKIAKGSSYAFTFEFNQGTNSEFIKKLVTVKWDDKGGQWSYVINQDFLNSLGIKGTFDADFYIEVERIETGDKIENTFVNIVNKQEMTAKVITRTPEPPKPKHPEKHALDKTGQKVLDGKEVQMGELIQYLLDGSMIPERHHTLHQYDGLDKLDTKHDRYTGNWKGIIKGTEYTAEKELVLPYDVTLKDGKVVKAGDKIAKDSSYAFTFEFNQGTNSEFIKKLVTVKWDDKGGQWSYVINQDFLNSLGIKGTFDADFYIEVERIETGDKIENTFVNIVNKQEMTAKVITRTPEPPKPKHPEKHALDKTGQKVLDGKEVQMGELIQYLLDGSMIPERHHTLHQYDGLDKLDTKHDRYTGNWKGIIKGTEYTAEKELVLPYDVTLKDGKVVKAGDKIAKDSSYAFTFEFNQGTNSEFIKKLVTVKWDDKGGQWSYVINQDFLNSLGIKGTFDADFYIEVERIETGDKIENTFVNIVNKQEMTAKVITRTPEPPKPKHPEKHALDKTGQKVLDGKEVQMGELIQYLLDGSMIPERHHTLYQYDGLDKLDTKHDRYTGNWKGIVKGTEYTAEKELTLPYDVILKDGKVVKAGDKIAKGSSYAFTFEFNQGTNSEFIKKLVTVKWDDKGGQWSYVINQDFLNSLGIKGTFDADFYIEVERIAAGEVENTFVNIVNGQEMTAKVTTHTPEPPKPSEPKKPNPQPSLPKHPEKHALDRTGKKVLDGKEVQMGELIQYLLDGSMIPERHDTLYQYDGLDKLDTKHDRYTGNWKGIIKGTEYTAEKDLTLPYDVTLKDGKVVKAGDKIAKGSTYAFTFEFNQGTNSEFIKKLVTVKWDDKGGQWSYVINQDFLNSLGVKGTFDADFYIEVERIAAGEVENTFVNIVNGQEMTAKVTTYTPEPQKPSEPKKPNPQPSLPNTGTASSMLPVVGMILGLLSLAGLRKSKEN